MRRTTWLLLTTVIYLVLIVGVVWGLFDARRRMIAAYAQPGEQTHWDEFRSEMDRRHNQRETVREGIARHSGQPIEPQPPKHRSARPPALELLQHHFVACLGVTVVGVSLIYGVIWGFFVGTLLRPGRRFASREIDVNSTDASAEPN